MFKWNSFKNMKKSGLNNFNNLNFTEKVVKSYSVCSSLCSTAFMNQKLVYKDMFFNS